MLAKQAWRLLHHSDSLLAQSLKARYYPRCDILQANKAHNPSFAWRSLLAGRDLLNEGLAWRVGNGERIRIGLDRWIPSIEGRFSKACVSESNSSFFVKEFFSDDVGAWNVERVEKIFSMAEKEIGLAIRLDRTFEPDRPFWPWTKGGFFTVRSGYYVAKHNLERKCSSSSGSSDFCWNWIWSLEVILKVKLFMWQCVAEAIPIKDALLRRSIQVDPFCGRCGEFEETLEHAFRDCYWMQIFWRASPLRIDVHTGRRQSLQEWFKKIANVDSTRYHALFASLLWSAWYARNLMIYEDRHLTHLDCFQIALGAMWSRKSSPLPLSPPTFSNFHCNVGWIKANCDTAVSKGAGVGIGVVITDDQDVVMVCRYVFVRGCFTVEMGECMAVREAFLLARDQGTKKIIVETDCQSLFTKLTQGSKDLSPMGDLLDDVRVLTSSFEDSRFSWTRRSCNALADKLAKLAVSKSCSFPSTGPLPDVLKPP